MEEKCLLEKASTDFVRDNMLINYCLWDDSELLIESFVKNNRIPLRFDLEDYYFCITGIDKKYNLIDDSAIFQRQVETTYAIYEEMEALLNANHCRGNCFLIKVDNSKQMAVLFSRDAECRISAEQVCEQIHRHFLERPPYAPGNHRFIATSLAGPYQGYEGMHPAYLKARQLNDLRFFEVACPVITEQVLQRRIDPGVLAIYENGRRLRNELCTGNLPAVLEQVNYVFDHLVRSSLDMNCCQAAHTFVIATLSLFVKVYGVALDLNFGPQDFFSLSEYQAHLENQIRRLCQSGANGRWYTPEVLLAMGFIHENYQKDISLKLVAEYTNTNVSHLSSEFNRQTGSSLPDFIAGLRIEKACSDLENSTLTIAQISREVGFGSERYFTEIFKKHCGKTPLQYRAQLNLEKSESSENK
ncbi:helix-turn-helix transcriptional regulator [Holdemania filiformis]|uniref:helix-turn-helix transcriptional regulator n=1 Tax=Holdemania filiformis TaxID=61171 RepID=UPI00266F18ED|nr:AraC family transcriptional regulator [Holdemania filiformis]